MKSMHYIIHRVNLDVETPDVQTARRIQNDAVRIFNNWIVPELETLLARIIPDDIVLHLDTLTLDLDSLEPTNFEQEFGEAFLRTFNEKIEQVMTATSNGIAEESDTSVTTMQKEERHFSLFMYFIKTGQLPWWCEENTKMLEEEPLIKLLEHQSRQGSEMISRLASLLASETTATERLFLQFSPQFIHRLVTTLLYKTNRGTAEGLSKQTKKYLKILLEGPQTATTSAINSLREIFQVILMVHDTHISPELKNPPQPDEYRDNILKQLRQRKKQKPSAAEGIHVDHAGLILLHPFFEYYFKEFGLLEKQQFRNTSASNLGIHLLNYLTTGRETVPEHLLTFEKFLCGEDLLTPIPRYMQLTDSMKEESDKLLQSAIGHWKALKSTSPDGLREGFIQRPGKLILTSFEWRLIVEGKGQDVLLNYLPWGYGLIKLPWLSEPLFVDWVN